MSLKTKFICHFCKQPNYLSTDQALQRWYEVNDKRVFICQRCCKKKFYFNQERCKNCYDRVICNGHIREEYKKWLEAIKGV